MTFAARDFSPRRGVSDEHIPQWICKERATKSGRKRPAALRVAPNLACGFVARRLQPHGGDAPSSRLATGQIRRNERHRIYASDHLVPRRQKEVVVLDAVVVEDAFGGLVELCGVEDDALQRVTLHKFEDVKAVERLLERPLQVGEIIDLLTVQLFENDLA